MMKNPLASLAIFTLSALSAHAADEWPRFLGPTGNNSAGAHGLPTSWDDKKGRGIKWKIALPGEGWSSPVISGDRIYCTTALEDGKSLHALCLALADGKTIWDSEIFHVDTPPEKHQRNSFASPTPLIEGDRLYATFGTVGTACLDLKTGKKIWENTELHWDQQNGAGGSMTGWKDLLFLACDGAGEVQLGAALYKKDGKLAWKVDRSAKAELKARTGDRRKAYGTPVVHEFGGKPVCLTMTAERLYAQDPLTGQELWWVKTPGFSNVPIPVTDGKQIYIETGFPKPQTWAIKVDPNASGDITDTHVVWKQIKGGPEESTPVVVGERLFMINDTGIASCLNTADGSIVWQQRLGPDFAASPLAADGHVYFFDTWNKSYVVEASDAFNLISTNRLEAGCMASPAVVGKAMILRTKSHLYRLEQ